jgi:hypothetical protein
MKSQSQSRVVPAPHESLRIGVLVTNPAQLPALVPVIEAIRSYGLGTLAACIGVDAETDDESSLLERLYRRWDAFRNRSRLAGAHAALAAWRAASREIRLRDVDHPDEAELTRIAECSLDLILAWGRGSDRLAACARHGVWVLATRGRDGAMERAESLLRVVDPDPVSRIELLSAGAAVRPGDHLHRTVMARLRSFSAIRMLESEGAAAADLVIARLRGVLEHPDQRGAAKCLARKPLGCEQARGAPGLGHWAGLLARRLRRAQLDRRRSGRVREWQIGLRRVRTDPPWEGRWEDFLWVEAPRGHYLADPFLFQHEGTTWLFAEDYSYATGRGSLVCAQIGDTGPIGPWRTALDLPFHLSFPLIFAHDGEIYLIPESQAAGRVDLYRCDDFPCRWSRVRTLWEGPALDTVPYRSADGRWYFFTAVQRRSALPPQLLLFHADDLLGPWQPHPASPLSMDVRYSRNGGRILELGDGSGGTRLFRISQDGSERYGCRMHYHEIVTLTPDHYAERLVASRSAPNGCDGTHHYERSGEWEVVDASHFVLPHTSSEA